MGELSTRGDQCASPCMLAFCAPILGMPVEQVAVRKSYSRP